MSDTEWSAEADLLRAWAGRCGTLVRDEIDCAHFGNRLIEAQADEVLLRLVSDRGTPIISVGWADAWHSARKLKAFVENLGVAAALDRKEPTISDLIDDWQRVTEAVRDPGLVHFEHAITRAYLAHLGQLPKQMGVAAE